MIKKANLEKAIEMYKFMEKDFSDNEIPDYKRYLKLTKENVHNIYLYEENGQEKAYFITMEKDNSKKILITHLAVIKEYRGKGIGKKLIEEIKNFLSDKKILIVEVESEKNAKNDQELETIKRRIRYYINAGFEKCEGIEYNLFNIDYYILTYNMSNNLISNKEIKQAIENIYDGLFSKKNLTINVVENI